MRLLLLFAATGIAPVLIGQSAFVNEGRESVRVAPAPEPTPAPTPISPEMRGDISMARKDFRQAIDYYRSIAPPSHVIYNKIGIAFHQLTELESAKKYYEKSVKLKPDYAEAVNNLGTIYYASKSYRRAVRQYSRALRLAPNSASIYSNLGTAWFARKNYQKATEAYQKALSLDAEVFEHRSTNGVLLQERSVEERAKFHYYLAKTYAKAGMADRALLYMRKCLEEGFKDRQKFVEEPDFATLQQIPEFQELLQYQPRVL
ncbi:MAG: tetratricopeptide repeat protein [Bryobacterales bacterium]|nr:tetratricopeptide repeat protein [Bryobacterales bacterium]